MRLVRSPAVPSLAALAALTLPLPAAAALKIVDLPPETVAQMLERPAEPAFVPGEVIVKMKSTTRGVTPKTMGIAGLTMKEEGTSGGEVIFRLETPTADRSAATGAQAKALADRTLELVKTLRARSDVEYAQPNYIFRIAAQPNDEGFVKQWHYFDNGDGAGQSPGGIGLPTIWESNTGSASVVVAVVDTGILPNHEDIKGSPNLIPGYDMISNATTANDGNGRDPDPTDAGDGAAAGECQAGAPAEPSSWHGTHVAGTIGVGKTNNGAGMAGINWSVRLQAVRVLGKCGGTMVDINDGIRWAAGLKVPGLPLNPTPAKVINMSLGGYGMCSSAPALQSAINDAIAAGATVVVAAGNSALDASKFFPASCNGVITVAASDARGYLATRYSNFGARVDIMAPGGDTRRDDNQDGQPDGVLSMIQGGYAFYNGTSMAAPHVAGVAALLLAEDPSRTPAQIRSLLKARALSRTAAQCPQACGAGLLSALQTTQPPPGTEPEPEPQPPGSGTVTITPYPSRVSLTEGSSTESNFIVLTDGTPYPGRSVAFSSSDTGVFRVNPAIASTGQYGSASTTVIGINPGQASLVAESQGAKATAEVIVSPRSVPALPAPLLVLLLAGLWVVGRRRD